MTKIEWTQTVNKDGSITKGKSWNPVRGCSIVSKGCTNCYAMKQAHRFSGKGGLYEGLTKLTNGGPVWTGKIKLVPEFLDHPLHWKKPRKVFVNSMSDLFHEDVPDDFIDQVFAVMALCPQHTFQILTKRAERMKKWFDAWPDGAGRFHHVCNAAIGILKPDWKSHSWNFETPEIKKAHDAVNKDSWPLKNVQLGVSVEDQPTADERILLLLETPAAVRWVSAEPLLGAIDIRQYLGHNPVYETETERGVCLPVRTERRSGNYAKRNNLENTEKRVGQVEKESGKSPVQKSQSGTRRGGLPASSRDDEWEEGVCSSSQGSVATFQRENTSRINDQPQRREEKKELPEQSGVSNLLRSANPRHQSSKSGSRLQPERRKKLNVQNHKQSGKGNTYEKSQRRVVERDSTGLQHDIPKHIKNSVTPSPGVIWTVCGGESGHKARPMHPAWVRSLRDQCVAANVPFLFKQWGEYLPCEQEGKPTSLVNKCLCVYPDGYYESFGANSNRDPNECEFVFKIGKKKAGRILDGQTWDQYPE